MLRYALLYTLTLPLLVLLTGRDTSAQERGDSVCASCHEELKTKLSRAAHRAVGCSTCHVEHEEYPHPANVPKKQCGGCHSSQSSAFTEGVHGRVAKAGDPVAPNCAVCHGSAHEVQRPLTEEFRKGIADTCGMCHDKVLAEYRASIHGVLAAQGSTRAAVCSDCHGEHAIQRPKDPISTVNARNIANTCGQCHAQLTLNTKFRMPLDRVESFERSFHGLALKSGVLSVANCASCHGVHNILPSSDPKSTINKRNLAATCGKCHPGTSTRYAIGPVHITEGKTEPAPVRYVRYFYLLIIPLTLGLMFLHNAGDWVRKLLQLRFDRGRPRLEGDQIADEVRMHRFERLQHLLLMVSFLVLIWTGFALVYPDSWVFRPLLIWENRWPVRGTVHRIASVVFIVVAVMHITSLVMNHQLRRHWYGLMPKTKDLTEAAQTLAYNVGLRSERPVLGSHSYIEKVEYWAVVWGAAIMIATGLLLWLSTWEMRWAPKWILDLATSIHFYEAVLAAAAVLIWHIYYVVFDPEVYPMDPAWLTGKSTRIRRSRRQDS